MLKPKPLHCLLMAALSLGACGSPALRDENLPLEERLAMLGMRQGEPVQSVWQVDIDGWQYLDKRHMVLGSGPRHAYLIEFSYPCRNLNFSNLITYSTTVGSLTSLDKIISIDSSGTPEYCLIGEIHRLEQVPKIKATAS